MIKWMKKITNSIQKGKGNTQICNQTNNYGLSATDATQMAFAIFREYYPQLRDEALAELNKLVTEKMEGIPQDHIVPPKARITVPTLQNASITEEQEIRELYANLLANSMNSIVKNGVHPSFVEIIKQLSPDEAKFLKYLSTNTIIPTITLQYVDEKKNGINIVNDFSDIPEKIGCEKPYDVSKYIDNLVRLGILQRSTLASLTNKSVYEPLKNHKYITQFNNPTQIALYGMKNVNCKEEFVKLTSFGSSFCQMCLSENITLFKIETSPQKKVNTNDKL